MTSSHDYSSNRCSHIVFTILQLVDNGKDLSNKVSNSDIMQLLFACETELDTEISDKISEPMVSIGIYIAMASFFCILAMAADLLHGFRSKKYWFPCKYFSLNAVSITVITVAMKLPVDLSSMMPTNVDQLTKPGSLAFLCTMMANLMPSLASMDNKTLLPNVIGLCILVITVIVNICIQINTKLIADTPLYDGLESDYINPNTISSIYAAMILLLLIIMISSSLTIPTLKEILEFKYQATNKISITDEHLRGKQMSRVDKLRQYVKRYWVMAETGNPQFMITSNPLSTASGLICVISLLMNILLFMVIIFTLGDGKPIANGSPYKWSTAVIFITQTVGVVVGTIAPAFRCFSVLSFNVSTKWNRNQFVCFKVEKYWTQKLHEWKQSPLPNISFSRRSRSVIYNSKDFILSLCIGFQKLVVVSCKVIWLIPTIFVVNCSYCWKSFKERWFSSSIASRTDDINEDLSNYVVQIDNGMELAEKTLKGISHSANSYILKAMKEQSNELLKLLEKSNGFKGVEIFDMDHVQSLLPIEFVNTWSLPVVTLTCIAVAIPNVPKDMLGSLFESVGEGLSYTHLVEEVLNCTSEYVDIQKVSMALWHEVENKCKWLDNDLTKNVFKGNTSLEIIKWFSDKSKEIVREINGSTNGELVENPPKTLIAANSMYRITQTIMLRYQSNIETITKKQLFALLSGMIADIFCACFTNIPRVITIKCHESMIEKREASVKVAAKLLGKTLKIIEKLETYEPPAMDDDKLAYIDEWRLYFKQSIP